jgi:hypothetical protein
MRNFLVENNVPGVSRELQRLEAAAKEALGDDYQFAGDIDKAGLLRRQIARRCIYGLDINPLAVELSRLALWIHTFVPGLPMSSLDHGLVCANSLTGIGTIDEALEALEPNSIGGQISIFEGAISDALDKAKNLLVDAANADEANKQEVKDAAKIAKQARKAAESSKHLFDAAVATRLGEINASNFVDPDQVREMGASDKVQELLAPLNPAHMPYLFPEVFLRDNPGFDVLLGNPPWEELMVEEPKFWLKISPGLFGLNPAAMKARIQELRDLRPDLVAELEIEIEVVARIRKALLGGPFPGIGTGDVDLYQAFAWRNIDLVRKSGYTGIVYPRSLLNGAGSELWRRKALANGESHITSLINTGGWVFEGVHNQYIVALVAIQRDSSDKGQIQLCGPFSSVIDFKDGVLSPGTTTFGVLSRASALAVLPQLPDSQSVNTFNKLLMHPRVDEKRPEWDVSPIRELDATNERSVFDTSDKDSGIPVLGGVALEIWNHNYEHPYAYADTKLITAHLMQKRRNQARTKSSAFYKLNDTVLADQSSLPFRSPRIAFRDVTNSLDSRTLICSVVPAGYLLTNTAPFLFFKDNEPRNLPYLLGFLSSYTVDWFVRKYVGLHVNFHIFNSIPIPIPNYDSPATKRLIELSVSLTSRNVELRDWAKLYLTQTIAIHDSESMNFICELEALVALAFNLTEVEITTIFDTFHKTTDYTELRNEVLKHFHTWKDKK